MTKLLFFLMILLFLTSCATKTIESTPTEIITSPKNTSAPTEADIPLPTNTLEPSNTPTNTTVPPTFTSTPGPILVFRDDFEGSLGEGWSWIREDNRRWSITSMSGFLEITAQFGSFGNVQPPKNLIVQASPSSNFFVETFLKFKPFSNYQFAGLVIYWDDKNVIQFGRAYCGNQINCVGTGIYLDNIANGKYIGSNFGFNTQREDQVFLRLQRTQDDYTAYYSEDGNNWMIVGQVSTGQDGRSGQPPKIGLVAAQAYTKIANAYFDYFQIVALP